MNGHDNLLTICDKGGNWPFFDRSGGILAVKMRLAHQLLRGGQLRVNEVALHLGYENPEHFSRRFKTYYRCPPSHVLKSTEKPF